jgi:superfamily II DNA or RNA helicase
MITLKVLIDHKLRVRVGDLPEEALEHVCDALSIPNLEREKAKKMDQWGWQRMPERIELFRFDTDMRGNTRLVMPRGFLGDFATGMEMYGLNVELVDHREHGHGDLLDHGGEGWRIFPWQLDQMKKIEAWEQGIIKSPAGSGKTLMILMTIQALLVRQDIEQTIRSLIIVNSKDILWQWQQRAEGFFGRDFQVGQIGDGKFEIGQWITVATAQTLHSRYDDLEEGGFFDWFGFVCLDECHHATAETYNKILNRFSARYRVGVSATPDKTGDFELARMVLGPIIHTTHPHEVTNLIKPRVVKIPTKFGFGFRGHRNRRSRSNYPQMIEALTGNEERNMLIAQMILENTGHHQLVVTKRLEHIEILTGMIEEHPWWDLRDQGDQLMTLTGKDSNEHREHVVEVANTTPCVILSTLADEALDIPRLDRIHLVFPQRNPGLITQQVGRVERKHPDKTDSIIFDYVDANVGALDAQWRVRRTEVYMPRSYKIEVRRQT